MYIYRQFPNVVAMRCNSYGLPHEDQTKIILETINSSSPDKLLVFDKSDGPTDNELEYLNWINNLNLNREFILVTSNHRYYFDKHPLIVHYPRYFFTMLGDDNTRIPNISDKRPYKISCLSRNPWVHKSFNFVQISKQPWFKEAKVSFGAPYDNLMPSPITTDLLNLITKEEAEYLKSVYPSPIQLPGDELDKFESNACPTYQQCYIDYAPESRHDQTFISEKTWKPIFSGQFFFILGPCEIIKYLRSVGVDVFDDLIDHGYDNEPDLKTKVDMIIDSINKFLANDLDQLWVDTYHRRKKNLDLMYDPEFQRFMSFDLFSRVS